jgi:hypothetical protein
VDVVLERMACEVVSLDVQDVMGTHLVDIQGSLLKRRLSPNGKVIGEQSAIHKQQDRTEMHRIAKEQLDAKEGCQLVGYVQINRVPGNFHISTHAYGDIIMGLQFDGYHMDYSYKINHISFGKQENFKVIRRKFPDQQIASPLDGYSEKARTAEDGSPESINANFDLIAVPSYFRDLSNNLYQIY